MKDSPKLLAACLAVGLLAAPAPALQRPSQPPRPTDGEIATWVADALSAGALRDHESSQALFDRHGLRPDIDVAQEVSLRLETLLGDAFEHRFIASHNGIVTLRGRVETEEQRQDAGREAQAVPGNHGVHNLLAVGDADPPDLGPATSRRPKGPGSAGPLAFITADLLGGRDIVIDVNDGLVNISGLVSSANARRYVTTMARRIPGVRAVKNRAQVRSGSPEDDRRVQLIAFRRMQYEPALQDLVAEIDVVARNGVVTLDGFVRSEAERLTAGALVAGLRAVLVVDNRLAIDPRLRIPDLDYEVHGPGPYTTHLAGN